MARLPGSSECESLAVRVSRAAVSPRADRATDGGRVSARPTVHGHVGYCSPMPKLPLVFLLAFALVGCGEIPADFVPEKQASSEEGLFRAGTAAVDFTPDKGYPLAGYGEGERRVHFPLYWGLGWPGRLAVRWARWRHEAASAP